MPQHWRGRAIFAAVSFANSTRSIFLVAMTACTHFGGGEGTLEEPAPAASGGQKPAGPVTFTWSSGSDTSEGKIAASLPDGRLFEGTYVQVRESGWQETYAPYWTAWTAQDWGIANPMYYGPREQFVVDYSGKVMAHLHASDGTRMRCSFQLNKPDTGLGSGGEGDCQLSNHEAIFDAVIYDD